MNSKTIMIAIVAVIAVVGVCGAFVLMNGNNGNNGSDDAKPYDSVTLDDYADYYALVFGNADGDTDIDAADVTLIKNIISGDKKYADYLLADANCDGKVNNDDATMVQGIIDGTVKAVNVIDCNGKIVNTPYPIETMFFFGQVNARVILNVLDLQNQMVAFATNSTVYGKELDMQVYDLVDSGNIKEVSNSATDADFTELSKLSFQVAVIEDSGMSGYSSSESKAKFDSYGATSLVFNFDNTRYSLQTAATLGVLVKNTSAAASYIELLEGVLDTIDSKINTIPDSEKSTCLSVVMSNSVSGTSSDYYAATEVAGGKQIADWSDSTKKFNPSAGDTWLYESKYNADYIIHFKSQNFDVSDSDNLKTAKTYAAYFSETYTFQNGGYYLLNGVIPLPARLAYMAEIMYPDKIDSGYGASIFQKFVDDYTGQEIKVSDYKLYWNVSEFVNYKAPTEMTLAGEFLTDDSISIGYSASTDVTITTNGTLYYPGIANTNTDVAKVTFKVNSDNTGGTLTITSGTKTGTATVTVTAGSVTKTITVNVSDIAPTSLELSLDNVNMGIGANVTLGYTLTPTNANRTGFSFESSDTSVVTINDAGYITGLKAGTATITVKAGSLEDTCSVTVEDITATGITLLSSSGKDSTRMASTKVIGDSVDVFFTVTETNASVAELKIVSSDESMIKVSMTPVIDGKATVSLIKMSSTTGKVTITATLGDLEKTLTLTVA